VEHTCDGLTIWYDTPDAPITGGALVVGARPSHPANTVSVYWREDDGIVRSIPATLFSQQNGAGQYFRAQLPAPRSGTAELLPVLQCTGRQVPTARDVGAGRACWLRYAAPPVVERGADEVPRRATTSKSAMPRFGYELQFLGTVNVHLKQPEIIGPLSEGIRRIFYITSGTCVGPRLNATIRPVGADWMVIQRDGVALPNVRTTWETADGALLFGEYSGVFDLGPDGYANTLRDEFPAFPTVELVPRFVTSHPSYLWLNRLQCVGVGAVDMKNLLVQYDLHAIKAKA
jgi:hypothetical protein